jgi:hypothetical protein
VACDDERMIRVYLECGAKWTFACAVDWPGWCRRAKGDEEAIESLLAYAPRYAAAAADKSLKIDDEVHVIGRVQGNATTDFGAPAISGEWDLETLDGTELERQVHLLEQSWRYFDGVVQRAPLDLRKGPRGGGRDRDAVGAHVIEAERAYARKVGARVPPRTPWEQQRALIADALRRAETDTAWPARYGLRRTAWHVIDHAWEIEDRSD